ncbi:MAG: nitrilase-related carbon-nitrogen hydrolase [Bacteroidota bacterium]
MTTVSQVQFQAKAAGHTAVWFAVGIVLAALSGVMLLLSFPPYGYWPLAWVALVPATFAQYRLLPLRWSALGPSLYLLFWLGPYLARLFGTQFGPFFTYLGVLIALLMFFISNDRKFHEATGFRWFVLASTCGWVGFEMVRATFIPLIATSAFISYTQATQTWLLQPVAIFSVYGFNLLIIMVNYTLTQGLLAWYDRRFLPAGVHMNGRLAKRWLAIVGVILIAWIGLSLFMLNRSQVDTPIVRVASLRSGFPLPAFQDEVNDDRVRFDTFASQARDAALQGAQVLFTSEMMFNFDPQQRYTEEFERLAHELNALIYIDYTVTKGSEPYRNEAVLLYPSGEFSPVYAKNHVPPGEPLSAAAGAYPVLDTPFGKMAAMICHDANYTDVARRLAANGSQLIAAGFREFQGFGEQAWTNVTFRAVENHTPIVMTGASYVSAVIDPNGRQVALDASYKGGPLVLVADVPMGSGATVYTRAGDVLGWLALAGFVFFSIFQAVTARRSKKAAAMQPSGSKEE